MYKKQDPHSPENYRPISLLSSIYKLVSLFLTERLCGPAELRWLFHSSSYGERQY